MSEAGFYKNDEGILLYAPEQVSGPDFDLIAYMRDSYVYPVNGWHWFDTKEAARIFFKIMPEAKPGDIINIETATAIPDISDRQFFQQAAVMGLITKTEAVAAVATGTIPVSLQGIIDGLESEDERFAATMLLAGATTFQRTHPFTEAVGAAMGMTSEQIDKFFLAAGAL